MRINIEFAVLDNAVGVELTEFRKHQGVGVLNDSVFLTGGGDGNGYHRAPVFRVQVFGFGVAHTGGGENLLYAGNTKRIHGKCIIQRVYLEINILYIRNQFIGNKGIFNGYRQSVAKTQTHDTVQHRIFAHLQQMGELVTGWCGTGI